MHGRATSAAHFHFKSIQYCDPMYPCLDGRFKLNLDSSEVPWDDGCQKDHSSFGAEIRL